jgi:hypothetical protein
MNVQSPTPDSIKKSWIVGGEPDQRCSTYAKSANHTVAPTDVIRSGNIPEIPTLEKNAPIRNTRATVNTGDAQELCDC